jgi:two-component system sensor histidine kinase FlrB
VDRGPGVSDAVRSNLFTPFFTTKKHGTGLGLSISHQIVRAHHGHLRYHAAEGGGAIFSVVLPREDVS